MYCPTVERARPSWPRRWAGTGVEAGPVQDRQPRGGGAHRGRSPRKRPHRGPRQRLLRRAPRGPRPLPRGRPGRGGHARGRVNGDASVRRLKGEGRPVLPERTGPCSWRRFAASTRSWSSRKTTSRAAPDAASPSPLQGDRLHARTSPSGMSSARTAAGSRSWGTQGPRHARAPREGPRLKALVVRLSSSATSSTRSRRWPPSSGHGWEVGWIVEPAAAPAARGPPADQRVVTLPAARAFRLGRRSAALRPLREGRPTWRSTSRASGSRRSGRVCRGRAGSSASHGPWRREGRSRRSCSASGSSSAGPAPRDRQEPGPAAGARDRGRGLARVPAAARGSQPKRGSGLDELGLGGFVILNPGGGWASKLWPPERYGAVARGLARARPGLLVTWGPGEEALADRVVAASDGAAVRRSPRRSSSSRRSAAWRGWSWRPTRVRCTSPAPWPRRWWGSTAPPTPPATARSRPWTASSAASRCARRATAAAAASTTA